VSVSAAASLLSPGDIAGIHQLQIDGLATAIALGGFDLVLFRRDPVTEDLVAQAPVTVARRWANRQPQAAGSEAAAAAYPAGDFRAYAPVDWQPGDGFSLPDGAGRLVPPILTKDGITTAQFVLDQGSP
jgi:hypothetical protein